MRFKAHQEISFPTTKIGLDKASKLPNKGSFTACDIEIFILLFVDDGSYQNLMNSAPSIMEILMCTSNSGKLVPALSSKSLGMLWKIAKAENRHYEAVFKEALQVYIKDKKSARQYQALAMDGTWFQTKLGKLYSKLQAFQYIRKLKEKCAVQKCSSILRLPLSLFYKWKKWQPPATYAERSTPILLFFLSNSAFEYAFGSFFLKEIFPFIYKIFIETPPSKWGLPHLYLFFWTLVIMLLTALMGCTVGCCIKILAKRWKHCD